MQYELSDSSESLSSNTEVWKEQKIRSWVWIDGGEQGASIFSNAFYSIKGKGRTNKWIHGDNQTVFPAESIELKFEHSKKINHIFVERLEVTNKGKWINTEEVCGLANKRKWSVNEDQRKNLKLFCAKPKSEE